MHVANAKSTAFLGEREGDRRDAFDERSVMKLDDVLDWPSHQGKSLVGRTDDFRIPGRHFEAVNLRQFGANVIGSVAMPVALGLSGLEDRRSRGEQRLGSIQISAFHGFKHLPRNRDR